MGHLDLFKTTFADEPERFFYRKTNGKGPTFAGRLPALLALGSWETRLRLLGALGLFDLDNGRLSGPCFP